MSARKMKEFEKSLDDVHVSFINRSRHVGQSYLSSIFTTLWAFFTVIPLVYRIRPKLVSSLTMLFTQALLNEIDSGQWPRYVHSSRYR